MMNRIRALALVGLSIVGMGVAAGDVAARSHALPTGCGQGHRQLLLADGRAEIFEAPSSAQLPEVLTVYGRTYGRARCYSLGEPSAPLTASGGQGVQHLSLAGTVVGYEEYDVHRAEQPARHEVVARNLQSGRVIRRVPTGTRTSPIPGLIGRGPVLGLVVKPNGALGWSVQTRFTPPEYEIHAADGAGSRVVAAGPGVDGTSVALAGNWLYWTQGGMPFSAPLN